MTDTGDLSLFRELNARFDDDLARTIEFLKGFGKRHSGPGKSRCPRGLRGWRRDPKDAIREYLQSSR
jgi:hypothetical protein